MSDAENMNLLRESLVEIKKLKREISKYQEPIAVIGMACRFPAGSNSPEEFWQVLESGIDATSEIPKARFDIERYYDPNYDIPGKIYTRRGGFLNVPVDLFDANFFRMSPKEVEDTDPQQRLLLEVTWEALEHAGIPPKTLKETVTGVYVGIMNNEYLPMITQASGKEAIGPFFGSGNAYSATVGRLSYFLGLQGPCFPVDTACSSSLVAINSACEALHLGECQQAIAGGVNLLLSPDYFIGTCQAHMLAPDGHCKTFDKSADGYARAEGCGMIVLKRLSDALKDGDHVYALIRGVDVNHNGPSSGITVPNGKAQEILIKKVCEKSGLKYEDIDYLEAHGTGTSLGDPIEVRAIGATYGQREASQPLLLGTVKSNIGHTESAAGVASVIKMILALNHEMLPANLNFHELNPKIDLNFPAKIVTKNTSWKRGQRVRRAGISSFGFSGTNAHLILEEAPLKEVVNSESAERPLHILTLSAKSELSLKELLEKYQYFLEKTEFNWPDICYTANTGRNHERYRIAIIAKDIKEALEKISKKQFFKGEAKETKVQAIPDQIQDWESALNELAKAYVSGADINWKKIDELNEREKVSLPHYCFQRERYWSPSLKEAKGSKLRGELVHPLLGVKQDSADGSVIFEQALSVEEFPYLKDHIIYDSVILPGAGFIELMEAALFNLAKGACQLEGVRIEKPLLLKSDLKYRVQVIAKPNGKAWNLSVYSSLDTQMVWVQHANAVGVSLNDEGMQLMVSPRQLQRISAKMAEQKSSVNYYEAFEKLGYHYGNNFRGLVDVTEYEGERWGYVLVPSSLDLERYLFHPALLDIAFHSIIASFLDKYTEGNPFLPISFETVAFYKPLGKKIWIKLLPLVSSSEDILTTDCILYNELGEVCAHIIGFSSKKATPLALQKLLQEEPGEMNWFYRIYWQLKELASNPSENYTPALVLSNKEIYPEKLIPLKSKLSAEVQTVDFFKPLPEELVNAIGRYSSIILMIESFESEPTQALDLDRNGINFLLHLAKTIKAHSEISVCIVNLSNPLSGFLYTGFCRSWRLEEPGRTIKYIQASNDLNFDLLINELLSDEDNEIHYDKNARSVGRLELMDELDMASKSNLFLPEANYIITGGLGGLGLALANWCVQKGARHLILCGRSAPNDNAKKIITKLESEGVKIEILSVDVSNAEQVGELILKSNQVSLPLKGIFHLSGIAEQGFIVDQTSESFKKVFLPKACGAWYLHEATKNLPLDYFVLFSSISSAMGSPGGSNYAVANAFLDGLAFYRKEQGLSALSLQWGPWAQTGMMVELSDSQQIPGLIQMPPHDALNAMEKTLYQPEVPSIMIANIDWTDIPKRMPTQVLWESFISREKNISNVLTERLLSLEIDERLDYLKLFLRKIIQDILKLPEASPSLDARGFFELGMDSLMVLDFHNRISEAVGKENKLVLTLIYDYPNLNLLSEHLMETLGLKEKEKVFIKPLEKEDHREQVAVIGMSCRFPGGANSPEEFWDLLVNGKNVNQIIPKERWDADFYYDPDRQKPGKMYVKTAHFLDIPIDQFDNEFFHISPSEAEFIDPQQRLLLELSWEAFENAGIDPLQLKGTQTGFFIGIMNQDYHALMDRKGGLESINRFTGVGGDYLGGPGRLSFFYSTRGPSEPVLTACSSSLVATHLAVNSLLRGESDLALAGGVNLILDPATMINYCKMGLLSPDGFCKTFDAKADGYGRGEGIGLVVLKRLSEAKRDNDNILAVICGSSMNHNGESSGLTVPSRQAQQELYVTALRHANIQPEVISFVEAHGTGTSLGDPIETGSIKEIYGSSKRKAPLWIGAVKSNIGHLEGAAGVASLIKSILCLQHRKISPQMHFHELNPAIELDSIPAKLPTEVEKWSGINGEYFTAINSFGATGVNAHLIIKEAPISQARTSNEVKERPCHLFTLAAKTEAALKSLIISFQEYLNKTDKSLGDIAYATNSGRSHFGSFGYRLAIIAKNKEDLLYKMSNSDFLIRKLEGEKEIKITFEYIKTGAYLLNELQNNLIQISIGPEVPWNELMHLLLQKYIEGASIDWAQLEAPYFRTKVMIPNYPFQRKHFWASILNSPESKAVEKKAISPSFDQLVAIFVDLQNGRISVEEVYAVLKVL